MTNNKDLNYVEQLKAQLNTPKTETKIVVETEDLYPDLVYEDIGSSKGYGPCSTCGVSKKKFRLTMVLKNCAGGSKRKTVDDVDDAADEAV